MEESNRQTQGPLETLAGMTNVGADPDSKMFSIDIDNVKFIFTRD